MSNFIADFPQRPVIVLGMHRSGTSLLTELLNKSGVFFGIRQDSNREARFFQDINRWIFKNLSTKWDHLFDPDTISDSVNEDLAFIIRRHLASYSSYTFTGIKTRLYKSPVYWGWKDPRTIYNIHLWKKIYPECLFIGIKRHGFDVAESLRVRNQKLRKSRLKALNNNRRVKYFTINFSTTPLLIDSPLVQSFDYGMKLWDNYNALLDKHINKDHIIYYEDLLEYPLDTLKYIQKLLDINLSLPESSELNVNINNKFKFREWSNTNILQSRYQDILNKHGY